MPFSTQPDRSLFIILRGEIMPGQVALIKDHIKVESQRISPHRWNAAVAWGVKIGRKYIRLSTFHGSPFDMKAFLARIGVPQDKILIHWDKGEAVSPEAKRSVELATKRWQAETNKLWSRIRL